MRVGDEILQRVAEAYRKVRNTFRFLLGNLDGFSPEQALPDERLTRVDRAFAGALRASIGVFDGRASADDAEFAADLWQVHLGEGSDEYKKPQEFFRRTYLTESLRRLLTGALRRIANGNGDPVVQLQTNFGGGKTHSMLALYHLFSGVDPGELPGVVRAVAASMAFASQA